MGLAQAAPAAIAAAAGPTLAIAPPPVDTAVLDKFRATIGERGAYVLREIIVSYLDDTPTLLASMRAAATRGDTAAIRHTAHRLKSSSAIVAATALHELCRALEDYTHRDASADWPAEVLRVEDEFARARPALEAYRDALPDT
jgi:HPt (histidine-containing phosphotransfer) domain-containing protein